MGSQGADNVLPSWDDGISAGSVQLGSGCAWAMQVPCALCVLRLNGVVAARSSAAFNYGDVKLLSAVVSGDVTP